MNIQLLFVCSGSPNLFYHFKIYLLITPWDPLLVSSRAKLQSLLILTLLYSHYCSRFTLVIVYSREELK